MDDAFSRYSASVDEAAATIALGAAGQATQAYGTFAFKRPQPDRLTLDGQMNGRELRMELRLVERESFPLVQRQFHWVQDYPSNW